MAEADPHDNQEQSLAPLESEVDYDLYCDEVFEKLEAEQNPELIDTAAQELLSLALRHHKFGHTERLQQFVFVSQLTMTHLRKLAQHLERRPAIVKQAEIMHTTYAQVYALSMIELSKLAQPGLPPE